MDVVPALLWVVGLIGALAVLLKDKREPNNWIAVALIIGCVVTGMVVFGHRSLTTHLWAGIAMLVLGLFPFLANAGRTLVAAFHNLLERVCEIK